MFRYVMAGSALFAFTIALVVWAARPDLIERDIKKPLIEWNTARESKLWQAAKEKEWNEWAAKIRLPTECANPRTEVNKLECRNQWQLHAEAFEHTWINKVRSGWKPDGAF